MPDVVYCEWCLNFLGEIYKVGPSGSAFLHLIELEASANPHTCAGLNHFPLISPVSGDRGNVKPLARARRRAANGIGRVRLIGNADAAYKPSDASSTLASPTDGSRTPAKSLCERADSGTVHLPPAWRSPVGTRASFLNVQPNSKAGDAAIPSGVTR